MVSEKLLTLSENIVTVAAVKFIKKKVGSYLYSLQK